MAPGIAFKVLANIGALWAAARYISGFHIAPLELVSLDFLPFAVPALAQAYIAGGVILALVNAVAHPILKAIGAALPLVTGAMLMVALNIAILYFGAVYLPALTLTGLKPLLWGGLLFGILNTIL